MNIALKRQHPLACVLYLLDHYCVRYCCVYYYISPFVVVNVRVWERALQEMRKWRSQGWSRWNRLRRGGGGVVYASDISFDVAYSAEPTQDTAAAAPCARFIPSVGTPTTAVAFVFSASYYVFTMIIWYCYRLRLLTTTTRRPLCVALRPYARNTFTRCIYTPPASKHLFIFPPRVQTGINILSSRRINSYNNNSATTVATTMLPPWPV